LEFTISTYVFIIVDFSIVGATRTGVLGFRATTALASKSFLELTTGSRDTEIGERGTGEEGLVVRVGVGAESGSGKILLEEWLELELRELGIKSATLGNFCLDADIF